jgi:arylsulfatase A-like enzyme
VSDNQPNIVFFFWDNLAWGEVGCYGGGVLRGAPTPRIDGLAADRLRLLNFNVEAPCTPSRSAVLTGRHPLRSGTQTVPITGGPDGLTRWEVTIAQALSDAGYATGMWGKWHLGSDPDHRSPVDFGFDEAVWSPRTADEVLWTMQSYFPDGPVTSAPYAGELKIPLEPEPIYSRKKGGEPEVIATYDAEFRAGFDRKITDWAIDFMTRSNQDGKPFYVYLPYTQVHIPPIPDPEYAGKTRRGNFADLLTQMDDFTGRILDTLDEQGIAEDTIVVWASDNGADPNYRAPAMDPDPLGGQWKGFSGPWRGEYFTSLEGSNRAPCLIRWPGKVSAGKVSNELVHLVDTFTTLLLVAGAKVPDDRQIDGIDMREFLLGDAEESGRDTVLCIQGNRLQAVKWRQWKAHLFRQDEFASTWTPYNMPHLHNLEWDPREEHEVDFPHGWALPLRRIVRRRDRLGDNSITPIDGAARVDCHGCGSRVGCVLVTAGDRRVVRFAQPAPADTRPPACNAGLPQRTKGSRLGGGAPGIARHAPFSSVAEEPPTSVSLLGTPGVAAVWRRCRWLPVLARCGSDRSACSQSSRRTSCRAQAVMKPQVTAAPSSPTSACSRSASVSISTSFSVATPSFVIRGKIVRMRRAMYSYPGQFGPPPTAASRCIVGAGSPAFANTLCSRKPIYKSIPARR